MVYIKSILVPGCSAGGIGAAIALALAKKGHHVSATSRDTSKIPNEISCLSNVTTFAPDVSSTLSVQVTANALLRVVADSMCWLTTRALDIQCPFLTWISKRPSGYMILVFGAASAPSRRFLIFLLIAGRGRVVNMSSVGGTVYLPWICKFC